jgi:hypothetical protein
MIRDSGKPIALLARADRRTHPRFPTPRLTASLWVDDKEHVITVKDLSMSGACVENAPTALSEGEDIVLATTFDGYGPFVVPCEIMHTEPFEGALRLGLRFMALEQDQTNILFFYLYDLPQHMDKDDLLANCALAVK